MLSAHILSASSPSYQDELPWWSDGTHGKELELVLPFLPSNPVIIEAGAHHGEDTLAMAKKWKKGRIYGFEANPASFEIAKKNTESIRNIEIFPCGLAATTGYHKFNVNSREDGSSSLLDDNHLPEITWYQDVPISVFCVNLDEWAASHQIQKVDYIWLDIEGAEYQVLSSAPCILSTLSAISTEINFREFRKGMSQFSDLRTLLESYGFTLYKMWGIPNWQGTAVFIRNSLLVQ